jgi:hypothetical protein
MTPELTTEATVIEVINKISTGSLAALLIGVLYLGWKQVWIWGKERDATVAIYAKQLADMTADRDFWRASHLRLTSATAQTAQTVAQAITTVAKPST